MRAVIQRVTQASVSIDGKICGEISQGLLLLLGVYQTDTEQEAQLLARKAAELRIFEDAAGKMNLSLADVNGGMLIVSNFTLCADASHGRRPSFIAAARPEQAKPLYEYFVNLVREKGITPVQTGVFGGEMKVSLVNDGPITILLDTDELK
ncbi:D-aminoacyl-tRNA deacylase [Acetanaerobacterium elongatum]|uniref:D-aminoacyl-tRNA deacylase n=1 Tax=Acetanaerobacterium elongatum TaxID=258515 RepID=A0A1H0A6G3_9FIRM|nr:D-aminoacyl-tRNA deacylase [Acetanaerobacterium elongatum]SDN29229.1 D-tyrosyl-tRNA(Tyr) deacylase [Acetanaerobacterium elongatum]